MKTIIGIFWIISLLLAFTIGQQFQHSAPLTQTVSSSEIDDGSILNSPHSSNLNLTLSTSNKINTEVLPEKTNEDTLTTTDLINQLGSLTDSQTMVNYAGIAEAYQLIEQLDLTEILSALELLKDKASDPKHLVSINLLLSIYARSEPSLAMSYIKDNIHSKTASMQANMVVLGTWAENEPLNTLDWYRQNDVVTGPFSSVPLIIIFKGLANKDLDVAISQLTGLSNYVIEISSAINGIAETLQSSEQFSYFLSQLTEFDNKEMEKSVVSSWTRKRPYEALGWVSEVENSSRREELENSLYKSWLTLQPQEAADSLIASATPENLNARAKQVVDSVSFMDPQWTLDWIGTQPDIKTDELLSEVLNNSTYSNPGFAAENLDLLTDEKRKIDISRAIYEGYARISQTKAEEFLASSSNKDEVEKEIEQFRKYREKK